MNTEHILQQVKDHGFFVFDLDSASISQIENIDTSEFEDGFYINDKKQIQLFSNSLTLSSVVKRSETYIRTQCNNQNSIHVSRVVEGGSKEKYRTHFDSHILTLVVPILMPNDGVELRGQLYLVPNLRKTPQNDVHNLITKLMAFRFRGEKNFCRLQSLANFQKIDLKVGQAILFNGNRSLHGNIENLSKKKRITFIYHMTDPFPNGVGFWVRKLRGFIGTRTK